LIFPIFTILKKIAANLPKRPQMFLKGWIANKSGFSQFLILVLVSFVCLSILLSLSQVILALMGYHVLNNPDFFTDYTNAGNMPAIKFVQIVYSFSAFLIPPFIFAYMLGKRPLDYLSLNRKSYLNLALLAILIFLTAMSFINYISELNQHIDIPNFIGGSFSFHIAGKEFYCKGIEQWMKDTESQLGGFTDALLKMPGLKSLAVNMLMLAFLPAMGEELLFRGTIQKLIAEKSGKVHLAVWLTAVIFSAIHMQFYGFIPRMLLGAMLGYLLVWSGNIWYPILGHFTNNGIAVLLTYFSQHGYIDENVENVGAGNSPIVYAIVSLALTALILYLFRLRSLQQKQTG